MGKLKTFCAWCGRWLRGSVYATRLSHGCCRHCAEDSYADAGILSPAALDALWTDLGGEG